MHTLGELCIWKKRGTLMTRIGRKTSDKKSRKGFGTPIRESH